MATTLEEERLAADHLAQARKEAQEQQFAHKEARAVKVEKIEVLEEIVQERRSEALNAAAEANRAMLDKKEGPKETSGFDYSKHKKKEEEVIAPTGGHRYIRPVDEAKTTQDIQDDIHRANANCPGLFGDPLPQAEVSYSDTSAVITLGENSVTISNDKDGQASYLCSAQDSHHIIEEAALRTALMYNVTEMAQATSVDFLVPRSVAESLTGERSRAEAKNGLRDATMAVTAVAMGKSITVNGKEFNAGDQEFKEMRTELMAAKVKSVVMSKLVTKGHSGLKPAPGKDKAADSTPTSSHEKSTSASEHASAKENTTTEKPASPVVEKARVAIGAAKLQQDSTKQAETKAVEASAHSIPKAGGSH